MPAKDRKPGVEGRRGYGDDVGGNGAHAVRYRDADAEILRECIDAATASGDAIVFARTNDAGAYVVRVLSDAGNGVWYPPTHEALHGVLEKVTGIARGL